MATNPKTVEDVLREEVAELRRKLADAEKSADRAWGRVKELESRMRTIREVTR